MARDIIVRGPNLIHPEQPSAVGSRNSLNRHNRDEYKEAKLIIDEEVDKILNHIQAKLPPEVLEKLDVMGSIKSKLHNYYNQEFQNMLNRYLVTMEDEMGKKVRDLVDKEEYKILNKYTPREISTILDKIGGMDKFNTGELEKSIVNMYGHLHGHIQRGIYEIETHTNMLLREKTDIGSFVRGENAYSIVKCSFKDNNKKPKTVQDIKLSINIVDSELISPIYHYQVATDILIKDILSNHIQQLIEKEIGQLNGNLLDSGKEELNPSEVIFEKFRMLDNYFSIDDKDENAKCYQFLAKKFLDAVDGVGAEINTSDFNPLALRESVKKVVDAENIRNRGFNTANNKLSNILDTSKMGYQYIENFKNSRECIIREYEDQNIDNLPDERYQIRMVYLDLDQIEGIQKSYALQLDELESHINEIYDICYKIYVKNRDQKGQQDWDTISKKYLSKLEDEIEYDEDDETAEKLWDEVIFAEPKDTQVFRNNPTYEVRRENILKKFKLIYKFLDKIYGYEVSPVRTAIENRLKFISECYKEFEALINPFQLQPGLILDIDIVSIKRKRTTMLGMANVLNEFLYSLSKGFTDTAFASFSRRRSTIREDIDQQFQTSVEQLDEEEANNE